VDNSSPKKVPKVKISEQRKHLRLTAMGVVTLTVQGEEPQEAYLASIGRGGFGVYLHRPVKVRQLVIMTLKMIEEEQAGQELKLAARVRWAKSAGQLYMVGLQFEPMSDQRYGQLLRHLNLIESIQL
jgi:Tfp pilus assembly protein PilZ